MFGFDDTRSRLFDELFRSMTQPAANPRLGVFPAVNMYDDGESFLVRAEIPGIDKESLDLTARKDQLTIRGTRTLSAAVEQASYHRQERDGGQFPGRSRCRRRSTRTRSPPATKTAFWRSSSRARPKHGSARFPSPE